MLLLHRLYLELTTMNKLIDYTDYNLYSIYNTKVPYKIVPVQFL